MLSKLFLHSYYTPSWTPADEFVNVGIGKRDLQLDPSKAITS